MKCSICGEEGHNSRTCPNKETTSEERDQILWLKYDNITNDEARSLQKASIDAKDEYAPEGRGTFVRGNKRELPGRIRKALGESDD